MPIGDGTLLRGAGAAIGATGHPLAGALIKAAAEAAALRAGASSHDARQAALDVLANPPAPVQVQADQVERAIDRMPGGKSAFASLGIWNAIVTILLGVLASYGIATDWIDPDQAATFGLSAYMVVSGAVGFYARWRAKRPISK